MKHDYKYSKIISILICISITVFSINQFFVIAHLDKLTFGIPNIVYLISTIYITYLVMKGRIYINSDMLLFIMFLLMGLIRIPFLNYTFQSSIMNLYSLLMPIVGISLGISLYIFEKDGLFETIKKYENVIFIVTICLYLLFIVGINFGFVKYRVFYLLNLFLLINIYLSEIGRYKIKFIISVVLSILTFKRSLLLMVISSVFISLLFNRKIKFRYKAFTVIFLSTLLLVILNSETLMTMLRLHYIFGSMDTLVILDKITSGRVTEVMEILTYYNGASDYILGKGIGFRFLFNGKEQHFSHFLLLSYGNMLGWIFASLLFLKMLFSILKPVKCIDKSVLFYKSILFGFLIGSLTSSYILYYPFYWVILGILVTKQKKMREYNYKEKFKYIDIQKSN